LAFAAAHGVGPAISEMIHNFLAEAAGRVSEHLIHFASAPQLFYALGDQRYGNEVAYFLSNHSSIFF
jgi:hypothetical protein